MLQLPVVNVMAGSSAAAATIAVVKAAKQDSNWQIFPNRSGRGHTSLVLRLGLLLVSPIPQTIGLHSSNPVLFNNNHFRAILLGLLGSHLPLPLRPIQQMVRLANQTVHLFPAPRHPGPTSAEGSPHLSLLVHHVLPLIFKKPCTLYLVLLRGIWTCHYVAYDF